VWHRGISEVICGLDSVALATAEWRPRHRAQTVPQYHAECREQMIKKETPSPIPNTNLPVGNRSEEKL